MTNKILYQRTKTGKINQWEAWNEDNKIFTRYGQVGGKLQTTIGKECISTNDNRINCRDSVSQAVFEVESMYRDQLRLRYFEDLESARNNKKIMPMLAQNGKKIKFEFPIDIQPKYDGLRCLTIWQNDEIKLLSRGNKFYNVKHIENILSDMLKEGEMLDGELYIHGISLQTINSWVKREQSDTLKIEYHIYDTPSDEPWYKRKNKLKSYKSNDIIKIVETTTVNSLSEIELFHNKFVEDGFEGAILRDNNSKYLFGKRSSGLLKWKNFEDKEFKIVGIESGTGKMSDCPIFVCKNDMNDKTFNVVPLGTMESRKEMFTDSNIGKFLTVKFIGRTEDMIPKFAVGKHIRSSSDLPREDK